MLGKDKDPHPADGAGVAGKAKRRRARKAFPLPAKMSRLTPDPVEDDRYAGHLAIPSAYQQMASHASPHTTKLYDRTSDQMTLEVVEKLVI